MLCLPDSRVADKRWLIWRIAVVSSPPDYLLFFFALRPAV
jgi:hypothetical protein